MAEPCYACDGDGYDPFIDGKSAGNCKRCKGGGTERVMAKDIQRYRPGAHGAMVESSAGKYVRVDEVEAAMDGVIAWCDERRNAGDWTTLGMVQHKLRELLAPREAVD